MPVRNILRALPLIFSVDHWENMFPLWRIEIHFTANVESWDSRPRQGEEWVAGIFGDMGNKASGSQT